MDFTDLPSGKRRGLPSFLSILSADAPGGFRLGRYTSKGKPIGNEPNQRERVQDAWRLIVRTKEAIAKRARQAGLAVDKAEDDIAELAIEEKPRQSSMLAEYEEQRARAASQSDALQ